MPRLGAEDDHQRRGSGRGGGGPEAAAMAYANHHHHSTLPLWTRILGTLAIMYIVHNVFFHDYRNDVIISLKQDSGFSEEIIDKYWIPKLPHEKKQQQKDLLERIENLENNVDRLNWKVFGTNFTNKNEEEDNSKKG